MRSQLLPESGTVQASRPTSCPLRQSARVHCGCSRSQSAVSLQCMLVATRPLLKSSSSMRPRVATGRALLTKSFVFTYRHCVS